MKNKYFYRDKNGDIHFYDDEKLRDEKVNQEIQNCIDEVWCEEVEDIFTGIVQGFSTQVDKELRPDESEIDEEGFDGRGFYWGDADFRCDYKIMPLHHDLISQWHQLGVAHKQFIIRVRDSRGAKYKCEPHYDDNDQALWILSEKLGWIESKGSYSWVVTDKFVLLENQLFGIV